MSQVYCPVCDTLVDLVPDNELYEVVGVKACGHTDLSEAEDYDYDESYQELNFD